MQILGALAVVWEIAGTIRSFDKSGLFSDFKGWVKDLFRLMLGSNGGVKNKNNQITLEASLSPKVEVSINKINRHPDDLDGRLKYLEERVKFLESEIRELRGSVSDSFGSLISITERRVSEAFDKIENLGKKVSYEFSGNLNISIIGVVFAIFGTFLSGFAPELEFIFVKFAWF